MTFKTFKTHICKVVREGNRVQKHNIVGKPTTKRWFTGTQVASILIGLAVTLVLPIGFSKDFSGYTIGFLGIFVGLFSSIVISMQDKSTTLYVDWNNKSEPERRRARKIRNYIVQFTGLTSYSILLALVVIILLSATLLNDAFQIDVSKYHWLSLKQIDLKIAVSSTGIFLIYAHRFITLYFLLNIFFITIYSTTSYFAYLQSEYKKIKVPR
jgi:hypothetical protein